MQCMSYMCGWRHRWRNYRDSPSRKSWGLEINGSENKEGGRFKRCVFKQAGKVQAKTEDEVLNKETFK